MALNDYIPAASGATGRARVFETMREEALSIHDYEYASAQFVGKPIADEILGLNRDRVSSLGYGSGLLLACSTSEAADDPVYLSASGTVSKAHAGSKAASAVIGWIGTKPTTTTCYIDHFKYLSTLSGGTPGKPIYLTDAGGYSPTPGSNKKVVGVFTTATAGLLFANPLFALGVQALISSGIAFDQLDLYSRAGIALAHNHDALVNCYAAQMFG